MSQNQQHQVTITGVPRNPQDPQATPPPRLDIRTLVKDERQFSLYVQAIHAMQTTQEKDFTSWFEISGIHGMPYRAWDGATNPSNTKGYCEHGTQLFPTWHRPYVACFEQILHQHATTIAASYTTSDKHLWQDAARTLRAPVWDWASEAIPPPEVIEHQNVQIVYPDGRRGSYPNPLLGYTFNPGFDKGTKLPPAAANRPTTVRCPKPGGKVTDLPSLIASLSGHGPDPKLDWRDETYDTITRAMSWGMMSNGTSKHGVDEERDIVNSLETIHGNVHVVTGGDGHMGTIAVAGFDPIFWMHHANVDRVLALWQAVHYNEFMDGNLAQKDLLPFWDKPATSTFWKSTAARGLSELNYTYPEFVNLDGLNPEELKSRILDKVNELYGPASDEFAEMAAKSQESASAPQPALQAAQNVLQQGVGAITGGGILTKPKAPTSRRDWTVRVRSKLHQFGLSYSVLIFVGAPPESEHDWRTSDNYVGAFAAFVNTEAEHCSNCMEHADSIVEGFVPLNTHLTHNRVTSKDLETVVPYLRERIHWRIQKVDGSVVEASEVQDLEVAVMSVQLEYSQANKCLRMSSRPMHHAEITRGKAGGRRV